MAKAFTQKEKILIRKTLLETGLQRFSKQGVRATRLSDLCKDVGIAKGSFYNYFSSKEELFMLIAEQKNAKHRTDMITFIKQEHNNSNEKISQLFDMIWTKIEQDPLLNLIIEHNEGDYIFRKIPPAWVEEKSKNDKIFLNELTDILQQQNPNIIEGLMTLSVSLYMQHQAIPEQQMQNAIRILKNSYISLLA